MRRFWSLGAGLTQSLFDGGLRRSQSAQAMAAYDESVANYRQTVLAGFQEVEDNLAALRDLEHEAEIQQDAVRYAREAVDITTNRYRAGIVSFLNVVSAQTSAPRSISSTAGSPPACSCCARSVAAGTRRNCDGPTTGGRSPRRVAERDPRRAMRRLALTLDSKKM